MGGRRRPGKGRDLTEPSREEGGDEMEPWRARSASRILPPSVVGAKSWLTDREEGAGVADEMRSRANPMLAGDGGHLISRKEGADDALE